MPSYSKNRRVRTRTDYSQDPQQRVRQRQRTVKSRRNFRGRAKKRRLSGAGAVKGAENKLKNFRQASILAVAITGFIMLLFAPGEATLAQGDTTQAETTDTLAADTNITEAAADTSAIASSKEAAGEAIGALQSLWDSFFYNLPKILIALATLVLAWLLVKGIKAFLYKSLGRWQSSSAVISLVSIAVWLLAIGVALSVVAGDIRALVGSLGLIGLALSWSLQTPIESFTGWLMNSFKGYYRVGDRIRVGDVFGDVYRIDFLTTTVWEIGDPYQPGFVQAEQPTGRLVTFPNNEILTGTVTNLTGDFPFVWDELAIAVANESDLPLSMEVLERVAEDLLGNYMIEPARNYSRLLKRSGLDYNIPEKPQVFVSLTDSWTNITIRYLVGARERRKWKSELTLRVTKEVNKPEYLEKIIPVYPRQQVQFIDPDGVPVEAKFTGNGASEE
ncbi:mechanosensitive ion channel family protein [Pontibacter cellulosilyticus]|uniref:Mechanosensitive ion channel n=1 Tax=Pontibacter cellulosilyticus TaxID=1720253 RepID=A0A923SIE8_9BACT|nr:mechanosensitive ion channel domain-containing protein [Pontibacter cellulosilyticus]MBC5992739.1 mechanosensitive ion channel [Pontibacter cellulosilyticus]